MIVGVRASASEGGDHLVGVHVRRRSGAGLEHVDGELIVVIAGSNGVGGGGNRRCHALVEQPELGVHPRRRRLDAAQPVDHTGGDRFSRHREVLDRLAGLVAPELCHVVDLLRRVQPTDGDGRALAFAPRSPAGWSAVRQAGVDRRRGGGLVELQRAVDRPDRPRRDGARDGDLDDPGRPEAGDIDDDHRPAVPIQIDQRFGRGTFRGEHGEVGTRLAGCVESGRPGGRRHAGPAHVVARTAAIMKAAIRAVAANRIVTTSSPPSTSSQTKATEEARPITWRPSPAHARRPAHAW